MESIKIKLLKLIKRDWVLDERSLVAFDLMVRGCPLTPSQVEDASDARVVAHTTHNYPEGHLEYGTELRKPAHHFPTASAVYYAATDNMYLFVPYIAETYKSLAQTTKSLSINSQWEERSKEEYRVKRLCETIIAESNQ